VISYISIPGEWNIFTVSLTLALAVDYTLERLVIELPTINLSTTTPFNLFDEDGGLSLNNLDVVPCDILSSSVTA
jgi:hypothetical protein